MTRLTFSRFQEHWHITPSLILDTGYSGAEGDTFGVFWDVFLVLECGFSAIGGSAVLTDDCALMVDWRHAI